MPLSNLERNSDPSDWDRKWTGIFDHYQRDLRHAHYMRALLERGERTMLELAAGSFRDMAALRRMGLDCSGMDFSEESVARARVRFPGYAEHIHQMSAFDMSFEDDSFDVTYHNGFWVLFKDEESARLHGTARITRSRMVATVPNATTVNSSSTSRE